MALGNTPKRQTQIFLEANKSFALNLRFTTSNGSPYDLGDSELRLTVDSPQHLGGADLFQLLAEPVADEVNKVQFQFQAADLDHVPGEYPYDVTLLSLGSGYSTPILKGALIIGSNTDQDNSNVFEEVHPSSELLVVLGNSHTVDVCLEFADGILGPPGPDSTWTLVSPADPGNPSFIANPHGFENTPLWVDTSEQNDGSIGDGAWLLPELKNGWVDYSVGISKPAVYRKVIGGIVVVEGAVAPGRTGSAIFTLPAGYRPDEGLLTFTAPCEAGTCRIDLLPTGDLIHVSGDPGAWVSLSDITFYGEAGIVGEPPEPPDEEEDMYGEHIITWTGTAWVYRGNVVVARPVTIPAYDLGARAVWDTSMDESVTDPPPLAIVGDVWFPHGDVDPLA